MRVTHEFRFEAAHHLPRHPGKCRNPHGHSWRCRVTVEGRVNPSDGMAFDFLELQAAVRERILGRTEHKNLNDLLSNPTAELLAIWIWDQLRELPLQEVQLYETADCWVTYGGPGGP